ncbi:granulocyte-macrophage colony-stimulating factor [Mesocricetus auratus]|uniref:Granulocyte-macrophage colony-stimulating factor n=1 Tax=Mesocricetus auratus TaxID=10036 RepID=A0A3Q0CKN5_MESAU|nr:granulocyte-macrophage colony-stimulating factor [Mesocricetus auratus]XP_040604584.1 granulocyte-macrophage colony-stimulating factor [Mesocricetus auratus]
MWLQILLFLGIVVCSFSAPTRSPALVTRPWKHVDAIKEALRNLNNTPVMENEDIEVEIVSKEFSIKSPTCVQTRLKVYENGLRGNFTILKGSLNMMASHYQKNCPSTPEDDCETQVTTFEDFIHNLKDFLFDIPFDCWEPIQK